MKIFLNMKIFLTMNKSRTRVAFYALLVCCTLIYVFHQSTTRYIINGKIRVLYRSIIERTTQYQMVTPILHCQVSYNEQDRIKTMMALPDEPCIKDNCECLRLRQFVRDWPPDKPKAVIYFLSMTNRLNELSLSLKSLDKYFNNKFKYPVIIFHEAELIPKIQEIRNYTESELFFQQITFSIPSFLTQPVPKVIFSKGYGYRHMCRFHAKVVYQLPVLWGFDYYMRLDDDSVLLDNVTYDWFKYMKDNKYLYGYKTIRPDNPRVLKGLWKAAEYYITENNITTQFFHKFRPGNIFYNNFEISAAGVWQNDNYSKYIDFIDTLGGIYYHRWGDAPIKTIGVAMFVPHQYTHKFTDIKYKHGIRVKRKPKTHL